MTPGTRLPVDTAPAGAAEVAVLSSAHDVRDVRLQRWVSAFRDAGLQVTVRAVQPGGPRRGTPASRAARRALRALTWPSLVAVRERPRIVVVMDPDLALTAMPVRRWGGVLLADVHEDYRRVAHDRSWVRGPVRPVASLLGGIAARAAARADATAVADDHIPPLRARRRLVVPNLPSVSEVPLAGARESAPRAVYIGDVRPSRGLRSMVTAVLAARPWQLDIVGPISPADRDWVRGVVGQETRVRLHGRLEFSRSWALAQGAWAGLALLEDTPAFRQAVPTKLYEYMGAGVAVVVSPLPRMAALVEASGAGRVARDADEAAAVLREWHATPSLVDAHGRAARRWAADNLPATSPFDEAVSVVLDILRGRTQ